MYSTIYFFSRVSLLLCQVLYAARSKCKIKLWHATHNIFLCSSIFFFLSCFLLLFTHDSFSFGFNFWEGHKYSVCDTLNETKPKHCSTLLYLQCSWEWFFVPFSTVSQFLLGHERNDFFFSLLSFSSSRNSTSCYRIDN